MLTKITNTNNHFTANNREIYKTLNKSTKLPLLFVKSQENLSSTRFIQNTVTNWIPKAIFARSLADLGDLSFLEFFESGLFFFAPPLLGQYVARKGIFSKFLPKSQRKELDLHLTRSATDILKDSKLLKSGATKRLLPTKAAIVLSCACIPAAEYALSFAKNLFTLKVFKKSNFNNIANLNKQETETKAQQDKVRNSAIKHLKNAGIFSGIMFGASLLLAGFGHKSKTAQKLSENILHPGLSIANGLEKFGIKSPKLKRFLDTYINTDFASSNGKLALGKGQLAITTISGLFGYSAAAEDRGKLDKKEVWTRVPIVVLYTIFGSAAFDSAFKHILLNKNKYTDLIKKDKDGNIADIPTLKELPELAQNIAKTKNTTVQKELDRLVKEKATITGVPYAFCLVFMGFVLAGISRLWTQYRYNHSQQNKKA
ncbi:MAG: hypothetical protein LKG27_08100 [Clostridiaceae bacterium]|jgi:hypothetical protein|nr:hypothetical protein [Clostridiaceae bacterium]